MDDTLVDDTRATTVAWDTVCRDFGPRLGIEPEKLRQTIRREVAAFRKHEPPVRHQQVGIDESRAIVVGNALRAEGLDDSVATQVSHDYARIKREHLRPFDDAFTTLESVRGAGLRVGLITNGPAATAREKIDRFGFERYMDVIVIEGEFGRGKPDRAVFNHALRSVDAAASETWHVGDDLLADVGGAQAAGIHAVWVHRNRLTLGPDSSVKPDRIIAHLHELPGVLGAP
jgi:putative hydrolase of the HAD superfamily